MKVKCYSVRLKSLTEISDKAFKAEAFDGGIDIIPKSQVYGPDFDVLKSEAWWITEWILEKKSITFSRKKEAWFDVDSKEMQPHYIVEKHVPERINPINNKPNNELIR